MPLVTISREHHRWDGGSAYTAVLDGHEGGELHDGSELLLEVAPGQHRLHFLNAYDRSQSREFRAREDSQVRRRCSASPGGLRIFLLPYYALRRGRSVRFEYLGGAQSGSWEKQAGVHWWLVKKFAGFP